MLGADEPIKKLLKRDVTVIITFFLLTLLPSNSTKHRKCTVTLQFESANVQGSQQRADIRNGSIIPL